MTAKNARAKRKCQRKEDYGSLDEAATAAGEVNNKKRLFGQDALTGYRCPFCHRYHAGHQVAAARAAQGYTGRG